MPISQDKLDELALRMQKLSIFEYDLVEKFILGSGSGGQKINKTSSCVYLKHLPTGIEVKCQRDRSREMNRFLARRELCEKIEQKLFQVKSEKEQEAAKVRRQKRRRSRKQKIKILKGKKQHSEKKSLRARPASFADEK